MGWEGNLQQPTHLQQCDAWAFLAREKLPERDSLGIWRAAGGSERLWEIRAVGRGDQTQRVCRPQRPVNLPIFNARARRSS